MQLSHRDESIDAVLCRPFDAAKLGIAIANMTGNLSKRETANLFQEIEALKRAYGKAISHIDDVLRDALKARKRGELKRDRA